MNAFCSPPSSFIVVRTRQRDSRSIHTAYTAADLYWAVVELHGDMFAIFS